ncbi:MAG: aminoacyl-histidine dipeptidase [Eubacterium sp.]|nr:aminoacyl-histidine dipeptidase [Eubacterium sp.]
MGRILEECEPKAVLHFFEELSAIPHGSGNTDMISDHLVHFAEVRGLSHEQDELGNVIIRKPAAPGHENAPAVILQGHMDMVCEKNPDCTLDMENEGLRLKLQDGVLSADGTTLGGDDGIAVAYMMALLDGDYVHPSLECVFTVDEEIGMLGAAGMNMSGFKGRMLLNIDNEVEGQLLCGCAGGASTSIFLPLTREDRVFPDSEVMVLSISGLLGGHSGIEINKGRANANILMGRVLQALLKKLPHEMRIYGLAGGTKDNAITALSECKMWIAESSKQDAFRVLEDLQRVLREEYGAQDPDISLSLIPGKEKGNAPVMMNPENRRPFSEMTTRRAIWLLRSLPYGVQKMSFQIPGFVETSLNLGTLTTTEEMMRACFLIRSSRNSEKEELISRLEALTAVFSCKVITEGDYPAWEYREISPLREVMKTCYREQYGEDMRVETIHAGVECGIFSDHIPGIDAISFGPQMNDIHTPRESMDLASAERTWKLLLRVLEVLAC